MLLAVLLVLYTAASRLFSPLKSRSSCPFIRLHVPSSSRVNSVSMIIFTTSTVCDHEYNMTTKVLTIVIICLLNLLNPVTGSGLFEFRFDSFDNPLGRDQDGNCCNNRSSLASASTSSLFTSLPSSASSASSVATYLRDPSGGDSASCSHPCRIFFRVCLKHYQNNIDTDTPCTFGEVTTPVLGNNGIQASGYIVPIHFNFSWPVSSPLSPLTRSQ